MKRSIIFFDIDGTILSEKTNTISESTKNAIKKARNNGHAAFINTGRTTAELDDTIILAGFDGFVCGCGTYIEYHNQVLYSTSLETKKCREIIQDVRRWKIDAIMESRDFLYYEETERIMSRQVLEIKEHQLNIVRFPYKMFDDAAVQFDKFTIWLNPFSDFSSFYKKYTPEFTFIDRGNHFYEVVPKGHSKATGIEFLLQYLKLPMENAYAIGDSTNDLPMLAYVKNSIAMGNSSRELFPLVSFVTKDVDDNGIEYALKHFGLI